MNLVAAYAFNGDGSDASGNGYALTVGSAITFGAGKNGTAATSDGTTGADGVLSTSDISAWPTDTFTAMAWVHVDDVTENNGWAAAFGMFQANSDDYACWAMYPLNGAVTPPNETLTFGMQESNLVAPSGSIAGGWHHVAITADVAAGVAAIWLDGAQAVAGTWPGSSGAVTGMDHFAVLGTGASRALIGSVDDLRVYDTALTGADITACMGTSVDDVPDPLQSVTHPVSGVAASVSTVSGVAHMVHAVSGVAVAIGSVSGAAAIRPAPGPDVQVKYPTLTIAADESTLTIAADAGRLEFT